MTELTLFLGVCLLFSVVILFSVYKNSQPTTVNIMILNRTVTVCMYCKCYDFKVQLPLQSRSEIFSLQYVLYIFKFQMDLKIAMSIDGYIQDKI